MSGSEFSTVATGSVDLVIANYVLMDTPDLEEAMNAFYRVLRSGGACIALFSRPCSQQGRAQTSADGGLAY